MYKKTMFCITKFVVQLAIDFDCKEIWVHFLQFHILPCCYNSPYTFNNAMNLCKKRKKEVVVLFTIDYDQTLRFICIYDFFFLILKFLIKLLRYIYFVQYINVGVEWNLQRSIFIPHKREMIGGK